MALTIHYTVAMPAPHNHRFHVTVDVSDYPHDEATFAMPVWAPGSYLIREFARHVEAFEAESAAGERLAWTRRDKASWLVQARGARSFRVRYQVYAFEWSVRTSHLTTDHGYFNGTSVLMYLDGYIQLPVTLQVAPPPNSDWRVSVALPQLPDTLPQVSEPAGGSTAASSWLYQAASYDELVDSPVEVGTHRLISFEVLGKPHEIAIFGQGNEQIERLRADFKTIVETTARHFDEELPYERYLFIVHVTDGRRGGLEHLNSTTLMVDRWAFQPERTYQDVLRLAAHEFYHTWNVKRLRPHGLGPFDYRQEVYTPFLWVAEGFTTYYDLLLLRRAGLISAPRYLEQLAERIAGYRATPGRLVQTLEESSRMTWIKFYRPDENSVNSAISYYVKGGLVALMLDLELRRRTRNEKSLDDLMRYLWRRYGCRDVGFSPDDFAEALDQVGESDFEPFLNRFVRGTEELPLEEALVHAGLELSSQRKAETPTAWLGLITEEREGRLFAKNVLRDGPAEAAGLSAGDELVAFDGHRLRNDAALTARLKERDPGQSVAIHTFRESQLREYRVLLTEAPADAATIEPVARPAALQRAIYESWLQARWSREAEASAAVDDPAELVEEGMLRPP